MPTLYIIVPWEWSARPSRVRTNPRRHAGRLSSSSKFDGLHKADDRRSTRERFISFVLLHCFDD
eukprot:scaffold212897_cov37-Attheya_sp.AAC.2